MGFEGKPATDYSLDVKQPSGHTGIWQTGGKKRSAKHWAVVWTVARSPTLNTFTITAKSHNNKEKFCVGEALAVLPKTQYDASHNDECWYVGMENGSAWPCQWICTEFCGGYKLSIMVNNGTSTGDLSEYTLSLPITPRDERNPRSYYAPISPNLEHAACAVFEPV